MIHALSIRQPYASLLLLGLKRYEARSWYIKNTGWVLVHASTNFGLSKSDIDADPILTKTLRKAGLGDRQQWLRGAIIGAMEVVRCHEWPSQPKLTKLDVALCGDDAEFYWEIGETLTFPKPIPCLGALNIWTPSSAVLKQVKKYVEII